MKRAITLLTILGTTILGTTSCALLGGGEDAKSANDAAAAAKVALQTGTKVCISEVAGVRFALEDALRAYDLTPEYSCVIADVRMRESGEPRAWVMRYQKIGDADWKQCQSSEEARDVFADNCIGKMIADLGGS
jgi:hypothetical protein